MSLASGLHTVSSETLLDAIRHRTNQDDFTIYDEGLILLVNHWDRLAPWYQKTMTGELRPQAHFNGSNSWAARQLRLLFDKAEKDRAALINKRQTP
jgi:hypothetical protein